MNPSSHWLHRVLQPIFCLFFALRKLLLSFANAYRNDFMTTFFTLVASTYNGVRFVALSRSRLFSARRRATRYQSSDLDVKYRNDVNPRHCIPRLAERDYLFLMFTSRYRKMFLFEKLNLCRNKLSVIISKAVSCLHVKKLRISF